MGFNMAWLTININPPKLDVNIIARTSNEFGYGAALDLFIFDSEIYTEEEAATHLQNQSKIEWMEIPE